MSFRVSGPSSSSSISSLHASTNRAIAGDDSVVCKICGGTSVGSERNIVSSITRRTIGSSERKSL